MGHGHDPPLQEEHVHRPHGQGHGVAVAGGRVPRAGGRRGPGEPPPPPPPARAPPPARGAPPSLPPPGGAGPPGGGGPPVREPASHRCMSPSAALCWAPAIAAEISAL